MSTVLDELYSVALERRDTKEEGSYTGYLFEQGLDKILKKCGEEATEVIIAAKNASKDELVGEIGDLLYHIIVLMVQTGVSLQDVYALLEQRRHKTGNLKVSQVRSDTPELSATGDA